MTASTHAGGMRANHQGAMERLRRSKQFSRMTASGLGRMSFTGPWGRIDTCRFVVALAVK